MQSDIRIGENMPRVVLPPRVRGIVYLVLGVVGVVLGAFGVGYAAAGVVQPQWLTVANAVAVFLVPALGFTAASNTSLDRNGSGM